MRIFSILAILIMSTGTLFAHPGHGAVTFSHGLAHPFFGLDHLLAMLAVGLLGARCAGHWRYLLPVGFLAGLFAGAVLGEMTQLSGAAFAAYLPLIELAIAASVLLFGLLLARSRQLSAPVIMGVLVLAAMPHGFAHAVEAGALVSSAYMGGMLLGSALLHGLGLTVGLGLCLWQGRRQQSALSAQAAAASESQRVGYAWYRIAGAALALGGCILLALV